MMPLPNEGVTKKPKGTPRHKFTQEEDDRLREIVRRLGDNNWGEVAAELGTRSARQCRERYKNYLSPNLKNEPWTDAEDDLLREKYKEYGARWSIIANFFETRSDVNIKNRWTQLTNRSIRERDIQKEKMQLAQAIDTNIVRGINPKNEGNVVLAPNQIENDPFNEFLDSCTIKFDWEESEPFGDMISNEFDFAF